MTRWMTANSSLLINSLLFKSLNLTFSTGIMHLGMNLLKFVRKLQVLRTMTSSDGVLNLQESYCPKPYYSHTTMFFLGCIYLFGSVGIHMWQVWSQPQMMWSFWEADRLCPCTGQGTNVHKMSTQPPCVLIYSIQNLYCIAYLFIGAHHKNILQAVCAKKSTKKGCAFLKILYNFQKDCVYRAWPLIVKGR